MTKDERADKVVQLYFQEGLNSNQIGERLGLHRHSVINIIHRRGLKPRTAQESLRLRLGRTLPEVSSDQLRCLYVDQKLPFQAIAAMLGGVSAQWVGDRLHALGVPIRTSQEGRWARLERLYPAPDIELFRDPAYEARRGVADHVFCKICGVPSTDLTKHLLNRHGLTRKDYTKAYPGARVTRFAQVAKQRGCDVRELMARFAENYLTPSEFAECVNDPKWDPPAFAACRLCGLKCKGHLGRHLEKQHDTTVQDYRLKYPGAPTDSRAWTASCTERLRKIVELAKLSEKFKPDVRELAALTKARISLVACLAAEGLSRYAMTDQLKPGPKETFTKRRGSLKSFWATNRMRIKLETQRVASLPKGERAAIAAAAHREISILA